MNHHHLPHTQKDLFKGAVFVSYCGRCYEYRQVGTKAVKRKRMPKYGILELRTGAMLDSIDIDIRILPYVFYNISKKFDKCWI